MTRMPPIEALARAAKKLMDKVNFDMHGDPTTKGGNGGLISTETLRASDELRRVLLKGEQYK